MKKIIVFIVLLSIGYYIYYCLNTHKVFNERIDANGLVMNCVSSEVGGLGERASEVYRFVPPFVSCFIRDINTERVLNDYWHSTDDIFVIQEKRLRGDSDLSRLDGFITDFQICNEDYLIMQGMTKEQCKNSIYEALKWATNVLPNSVHHAAAQRVLDNNPE